MGKAVQEQGEDAVNIDSVVAKIVADNDQDLSGARDWVKEETTENIMATWANVGMMVECNDEMLSRIAMLAQLKLGELLVEAYEERNGKDTP